MCDQTEKEIQSSFLRRGGEGSRKEANYRRVLQKVFRDSFSFFCPSQLWLLQLLAEDLHLIQTVHSSIFSSPFLQLNPYVLRITNRAFLIAAAWRRTCLAGVSVRTAWRSTVAAQGHGRLCSLETQQPVAQMPQTTNSCLPSHCQPAL